VEDKGRTAIKDYNKAPQDASAGRPNMHRNTTGIKRRKQSRGRVSNQFREVGGKGTGLVVTEEEK